MRSGQRTFRFDYKEDRHTCLRNRNNLWLTYLATAIKEHLCSLRLRRRRRRPDSSNITVHISAYERWRNKRREIKDCRDRCGGRAARSLARVATAISDGGGNLSARAGHVCRRRVMTFRRVWTSYRRRQRGACLILNNSCCLYVIPPFHHLHQQQQQQQHPSALHPVNASD